MKISIAMATYNGALYILEQLQSFVDQTRQPDELIITDDCSTDETEAIVREFAKTAPFIVEFYRNEKNLGYCGNFNSALMKTTGDWVFLSDQDDVWFPEKIEHMISVAERNPEALVVMNDAALTDGELNEVGLTKIGQIRSAGFSMHAFIMGCCACIKRQLLDMRLPIPEGCKAHDNWIVIFADNLQTKVVDKKVLQYYRRHETNESQFIVNRTTKVNRFHVKIHSFVKSIRKLKEVLGGQGYRYELSSLAHYQIEVIGLQNALTAAPVKYHKKINNMIALTLSDIEIYKVRIHMRKKNFLSRVFVIPAFLFKGGYRKQSKPCKAAIRDLIG